MDIVKKVAFILLLVGGLNWGLVGIFGYDLVAVLLPSPIATLVYILVGVSAVVSIFTMKGCGSCKAEDDSMEESVDSNENTQDNDSMNNHQV